LKKENILLAKRTNYGEQMSMNLDKKDSIMSYIDVFLKKD